MKPIPTHLDCEHPIAMTQALVKRYRKAQALAGLDLTVPDGSIYLLVGPNGAGKTTTMKILLDMVRPTTGNATVFGLDPIRQGAAVRAGIGYVPEGPPQGVGWMRVGHYLKHLSRYRPSWDADYEESLVRLLEIDRRARLSSLSKGESRRVQIVGSLAYRPRLLLLDEPADGLDPVARDRLSQALSRHLADAPTTALISTHHVQEMDRLADHMGVIEKGRMRAQLSREEYRRRLHRYLFEPPPGFNGIPELNDRVLERNGSGTEAAWTIWGEESEVRSRLAAAGATIRDVRSLQLEEAAVALLTTEEEAS